MEGYDTTLLGSFNAYPSYQRKYGKYYGGTAGWQLSAPWQTGIGDIQAVGNLIGAMLNGYFTAKVCTVSFWLINQRAQLRILRLDPSSELRIFS
jgi:hypothetical protein